MAYLIFAKDADNLNGTLYRIAENQSDLNSLNINLENYKIIEISQPDFNDVKFKVKQVNSYNNNTVNYENINYSFLTKEELIATITDYKQKISDFTNANKNHSQFQKWNNYLIQLNSVPVHTITYPLNKSLEKYFEDQSQPSLNPLQIP